MPTGLFIFVLEEGECFAPLRCYQQRRLKFSPLKRAPETKASFWIWFQTMRNPMVFVIFLWDNGNCPPETTLGPIFGPFLMKFSNINQTSTRSIPNAKKTHIVNQKHFRKPMRASIFHLKIFENFRKVRFFSPFPMTNR